MANKENEKVLVNPANKLTLKQKLLRISIIGDILMWTSVGYVGYTYGIDKAIVMLVLLLGFALKVYKGVVEEVVKQVLLVNRKKSYDILEQADKNNFSRIKIKTEESTDLTQ